MDIFLALLRTLVFVVATVVATVYVGRRIGRGHALLWTGTTLLVTHWLIQFGWTTYAAGAPEASPEPTGWLSWVAHLLPFLAAVALIWGIGQAAGASTRGAAAGRSGARVAGGTGSGSASPESAAPVPASQPLSGQGTTTLAPAAGVAGGHAGQAGGGPVASPRVTPGSQAPGARTPTQSRPKTTRPPGLIVPHAVPVVMTPSASHHSPPDPDPVVDLGPDDEDPVVGTPVPPPTGWAPVVPPVQPTEAASGTSGPSDSPDRPAER